MKYSIYAKNNSLRKILAVLLGSFALVVLAGFGILHKPVPVSKPLPIAVVAQTPKPQPIRASLPLRLTIPQIKVDAEIEDRGLTANGEMTTTKNPSTVAWYDLGPRPGDGGSAVIAGHFGWKDNVPAAFDHLTKLQKGDQIFITDDKGAALTFVVQKVQLFGKHDDAKSVFSSNDGKSHLNLITCEGTWDSALHSYSNRFVVFSDKQ